MIKKQSRSDFYLVSKSELKVLGCVQLFVTPWTVAHQVPLSIEFSRPEYWSGQPFPSPGDLSNPGIEPMSSALQVDSLLSQPPGKPFQKQITNPSGISNIISCLYPLFPFSFPFSSTLEGFQEMFIAALKTNSNTCFFSKFRNVSRR